MADYKFSDVPPLDWQTPIVYPDGKPTNQFQRLWQLVFQSGSASSAVIATIQAQIASILATLSSKADKAIQIIAGTGLSGGGDLSANRTINLANTTVTPGSYTNTNLTVDAQGRITVAANGTAGGAATWGSITGTLSAQTDLQTALNAKANTTITISAGTGLTGGGDLTTNRTLTLSNTAVSPGSYTRANITVDSQGRITAASNGAATTWGSITGTLSSQTDLQTALNAKVDTTRTISTGTGLSGGGDLSANRTLILANTAVSPGSYTYAGFTVDAQGRLTAASSGATPVAAVTSTNTAIVKFNGTLGQVQNSGVLIDASNNVTTPGAINVTGSSAFGGTAINPANILTVARSILDPSGLNSGCNTQLTVLLTADNSQEVRGGSFNCGVNASAFNYNGTYRGGTFTSQGGAGVGKVVGKMEGGYFLSYLTTASTLGSASAGQFELQNLNASGIITNAYGARVILNFNNGTITNTYGFYCGDVTSGTQTNQAYSFYASDTNARNYFAGNSGFGTLAPAEAVDVTGNAKISGTVSTGVYTVATLPSASPAGKRACVSDALAPTVLSTVVGGGSTLSPVYSDGTNWKVG